MYTRATTGAELRDDALYAPLTGHPASTAARKLTDEVLILHKEQARLSRNVALEKHRQGVGAMLADLLCVEEGRWLHRTSKSTAHTGEAIGQRIYTQVRQSLDELGFVEIKERVVQWLGNADYQIDGEARSDGDGRRVERRWSARWRATPALVDLATSRGITRENAKEHFTFKHRLPKDPLQLRGASSRTDYGLKLPGRSVSFARTDHAERLENTVRAINEYLDKQELTGGRHEGFRRIFQKGDDASFAWNMGGRLYSTPPNDNYQMLPWDKAGPGEQTRRKLRINGDPVAEVDIRACFLTLFHAWHGVSLDVAKDPYVLPGLGPRGRDAVKMWFVATFGNAMPVARWPRELLKNYAKRNAGKSLDTKRYPVAHVREKALAAFPVLASWGQPDNSGRVRDWSDLQFAESEIIIASMGVLMREHNIPSYAVHDSLIVQAQHAYTAHGVLSEQFRSMTGHPAYVGIKPKGNYV